MGSSKPKMWDCLLTSKNYKHYALSRYIGTEQTWSCFFKTLKILDRFKKYVTMINADKYDEKSYRQLIEATLQSLVELSYYYGHEALSRLSFFNMNTEYFSKIKTLLEYKGLLSPNNIPEANISAIPYDTEMIDYIQSLKKSL